MILAQAQVEQKIIWETDNLLIEKAENDEFSTRKTRSTDYPLHYEFSIYSSDYLNPNTDSITFWVPIETYNECFKLASAKVMGELQVSA